MMAGMDQKLVAPAPEKFAHHRRHRHEVRPRRHDIANTHRIANPCPSEIRLLND
jgi:hypothetical protein